MLTNTFGKEVQTISAVHPWTWLPVWNPPRGDTGSKGPQVRFLLWVSQGLKWQWKNKWWRAKFWFWLQFWLSSASFNCLKNDQGVSGLDGTGGANRSPLFYFQYFNIKYSKINNQYSISNISIFNIRSKHVADIWSNFGGQGVIFRTWCYASLSQSPPHPTEPTTIPNSVRPSQRIRKLPNFWCCFRFLNKNAHNCILFLKRPDFRCHFRCGKISILQQEFYFYIPAIILFW